MSYASVRRLLPAAALTLLTPAAFLAGRAFDPPTRYQRLEVDELRCKSFTLVGEDSGEPLVRIREKPEMGAWGLFVLDGEGRERAQLIVLRHSDNPQLMFLDEAYENDELERIGYRLSLSLVGEESEPEIRLFPKSGHGLAQIHVRDGSSLMWAGDTPVRTRPGGSFVAITSEGEVFQAP